MSRRKSYRTSQQMKDRRAKFAYKRRINARTTGSEREKLADAIKEEQLKEEWGMF